MGLVTFSLFHLFFSLETANEERTLFSSELLENPILLKTAGLSLLTIFLATTFGPLQRLLDTTDLTVEQWAICIAGAASIIVIEEVRKFISPAAVRRPPRRPSRRRRRSRPDRARTEPAWRGYVRGGSAASSPTCAWSRAARSGCRATSTRRRRPGASVSSEAKAILGQGIEYLAEYQARLAAQDDYGVLVCLQAMDAAGKDGAIRHVMSGVNPQGVEVHSFKVPSSEDLDHDYLWRYQKRLPERGHIGIFNRSYYEEVLVVRVHPQILEGQKIPAKLKDRGIWKRRYREINDWEHYLTDQGYRIVKIFLNVSKDEQRDRLVTRIDDAERNWKFSAADVNERRHWDAYQAAFADVLSNTSTPWAPWYVIPADNKPFARLAARCRDPRHAGQDRPALPIGLGRGPGRVCRRPRRAAGRQGAGCRDDREHRR